MSTRWVLMTIFAMGCVSNWDLRGDLPVNEPVPFYLDVDGDGWGDRTIEEPQLSVKGDAVSGYTARNRRDCSDDDPNITGMVGSICPSEMVASPDVQWGGTSLEVEGTQLEFVFVYGTTPPVWGDAAEAACVDWGNGVSGRLAMLTTPEKLNRVQQEVAKYGVTEFASFVDLKPVEESVDGRDWVWSDGTVLEQGDLCDNFIPQPSFERLAMIFSGGGWCFGSPDNAGAGDYTKFYGHFVCERVAPVASDYSEYLPPDGAE